MTDIIILVLYFILGLKIDENNVSVKTEENERNERLLIEHNKQMPVNNVENCGSFEQTNCIRESRSADNIDAHSAETLQSKCNSSELELQLRFDAPQENFRSLEELVSPMSSASSAVMQTFSQDNGDTWSMMSENCDTKSDCSAGVYDCHVLYVIILPSVVLSLAISSSIVNLLPMNRIVHWFLGLFQGNISIFLVFHCSFPLWFVFENSYVGCLLDLFWAYMANFDLMCKIKDQKIASCRSLQLKICIVIALI